MFVFNKNKIKTKEIVPGFFGRFLHSEHITTAFWEIKKDSELPEHDHIFEQITQVTKGEFEMFIEEKRYLLKEGDVAVIPGNITHSGKALTDCEIIDTFYPVRKEYS